MAVGLGSDHHLRRSGPRRVVPGIQRKVGHVCARAISGLRTSNQKDKGGGGVMPPPLFLLRSGDGAAETNPFHARSSELSGEVNPVCRAGDVYYYINELCFSPWRLIRFLLNSMRRLQG